MQSSVADKGLALKDYPYTKIDVTFGAAWGNVISAFVVISTAVTLYVAGIPVETAEDAALALAPLAGNSAKMLFSAGLLGASLLALSVLPLSTTYAFCEAFGFERGLNRRVREAPAFYGIFAGIIGISVLIVLIPGIPLFPIMWLSQTLNAFFLPVLLFLVLKLSSSEKLMGSWKYSRLLNILAAGLTVFISLITLTLFVTMFWNPAL